MSLLLKVMKAVESRVCQLENFSSGISVHHFLHAGSLDV